MHWLRRNLTYANVVATLALVFAMGGSAIAAQHYLINSTRQINPKVLHKLKGNRGLRGAAGGEGLPGPQGLQGLQGVEGKKGTKGDRGPEGQSALVALSAGASESGVFAVGAQSSDKLLIAAVTFPKPLAEAIPVAHVFYATPNEHCAAPGKADPGYLCIYSSERHGLGEPTLLDPENAMNTSTGTVGFGLIWTSTGSELESDSGTYTVTAPS